MCKRALFCTSVPLIVRLHCSVVGNYKCVAIVCVLQDNIIISLFPSSLAQLYDILPRTPLHKFFVVKYENMMIKWCTRFSCVFLFVYLLASVRCLAFSIRINVHWAWSAKYAIKCFSSVFIHILCIRHRHDIKIHLINEVNHSTFSRFVFLWFSKWTNVSGIWPILLFSSGNLYVTFEESRIRRWFAWKVYNFIAVWRIELVMNFWDPKPITSLKYLCL